MQLPKKLQDNLILYGGLGIVVAFVYANFSRGCSFEKQVYKENSFFTCVSFKDLNGDGIADLKNRKQHFTNKETISVVGYVVDKGFLRYRIVNSKGDVIVESSRENKGFGLTHIFQPGELDPDGYVASWFDGNGRALGENQFIVVADYAP